MQNNSTTPTTSTPARPLRLGLWYAVSSEAQAGEEKSSLPLQAEECRTFAHSGLPARYPGHTGVIVREYTTIGTRDFDELEAAKAVHPSYTQLMADIKAHAIDALVVKEMSRLGRNAALLATIHSVATTHHVQIVPLDSLPPRLGGQAVDANAELLLLLQSGMAAQEKRRQLERTQMGREGRAALRGLFVGKPPYGYRTAYEPDTGKAVGVVIEPAEAAVVRRTLIDLYLNSGLSYATIAQALNAEGIPAPAAGGGWQHTQRAKADARWAPISVSNLVAHARVYAGTVTYNLRSGRAYIQRVRDEQGNVRGVRKSPTRRTPIQAQGAHPSLITPEQADAIEAARAARAHGYRSRLLSGMVWCGVCGKLMEGTTTPAKDGGRIDQYGCFASKAADGRRPKAACNQRIHESILLDAIEAAVVALEDTPDEQLAAAQPAPVQGGVEAELRSKEAARKALDAERETVKRMEIKGRLTEAQADKEHARLDKEQAKIEAALVRLRAKQQQEADAGARTVRLQEVRRSARELLAQREAEPEIVRGWLRRHVRLTVLPHARRRTGVRRVTVAFV